MTVSHVSHGCSLFLNEVRKALFTFRLLADLCFYLQRTGNVRGPWQRCQFQEGLLGKAFELAGKFRGCSSNAENLGPEKLLVPVKSECPVAETYSLDTLMPNIMVYWWFFSGDAANLDEWYVPCSKNHVGKTLGVCRQRRNRACVQSSWGKAEPPVGWGLLEENSLTCT